MHMWYWFGSDLGSFLLSGYNVTTIWGLLCTCLGLVALAILYEGMKILQMKLQNTTAYEKRQTRRTSENSSLLSRMTPRAVEEASVRCPSWCAWTIQVSHWSLHTTLGYILMMAVMTYNVYINIALVLGGCLGYWIFGPRLIQMKMARLRQRQRLLDCDKECADNIVNHQRQGSAVSIVAEELVTEATIEVHGPRNARSQLENVKV